MFSMATLLLPKITSHTHPEAEVHQVVVHPIYRRIQIK